MEQQNSCENCYYFYQHYYRSQSGRFYKVFFDGHCDNDKLTRTASKKIIAKCLPCEFWQPKENQIAEKRENVISRLFEMKKRLDEIASILNDDD